MSTSMLKKFDFMFFGKTFCVMEDIFKLQNCNLPSVIMVDLCVVISILLINEHIILVYN